MLTVPKAIHRLNVIPLKIQMSFHTEIEKVLKCVYNHKRPLTVKADKQKE